MVLNVAEEAVAAGKQVVFLAEGGIEGGGYFNANEQHMVAQALKERFGDKIVQDTWDDRWFESMIHILKKQRGQTEML